MPVNGLQLNILATEGLCQPVDGDDSDDGTFK